MRLAGLREYVWLYLCSYVWTY